MQTKLLIDGHLVAGRGRRGGGAQPGHRARLIARCARPRRRRSRPPWQRRHGPSRPGARTTPQERSLLLLKLADRIEAEAAALRRSRVAQLRQAPAPARSADELPAIVDCFRFFAGAARCLPGSAADEYLAGHTSMIRRDPVGVVAQITPWNYPLMMAAWKMAPGAGGRQHRRAQALGADAAHHAQARPSFWPRSSRPGVVNIVTGRGDTVGAPLINHPACAWSR